MKRSIRTISTWLLCSAFILAAAAAPAGDKTIGAVMSGNISYYQEIHKAFANGLIKEEKSMRLSELLPMPFDDGHL